MNYIDCGRNFGMDRRTEFMDPRHEILMESFVLRYTLIILVK